MSRRAFPLLTLVAIVMLAPGAHADELTEPPAGELTELARQFGITVDEFEELLETQRSGRDLITEVRNSPDDYGGVYWDWASDVPGFVVQQVGDVRPRSSAVEYTLVAVEYTITELESIRDELATLAGGIPPLDSGFVSVAIDEPLNRVRVVVRSGDAQFVKTADSYGSAVLISIGEPSTPAVCNTRQNCTPFRGGIRMNGPMLCSYGFNGRRNGSLVVVTSGHCDWNANGTWNHPRTQSGLGQSTLVGYSSKNGLHNGLDTDVLRITAYTGAGAQTISPRNRIYHSSSNKNLQISGTTANLWIYTGMLVQRSGFKSAAAGIVDGGRMFYVIDVVGGGLKFAWGYPTTTPVIQGDSGGPFYHQADINYWELLGFTSTVDGIFASQADAKNVLDIDFYCTTDAC